MPGATREREGGKGALRTYRYAVVFEPEPDGGWHASCPALKGCHTHGSTRQEALRHIQEAMRAYLESLRKHGEEIPPEDDVEFVEVAA